MFSQIWRRRDASGMAYNGHNHVELVLAVPPAQEPVTMTQFKQHARIPYNQGDDILDLYLKSARQLVERFLRRSLITQTWDLRTDWGPAWVELPRPPLQSVTTVYTTNLANIESVVPTTTYIVDVEHNLLSLNIGNVWPLHRGKAGFRARYVAGYGDNPNDVPEAIRLQILAVAAQIELDRTNMTLSPLAKEALQPYRIDGEPIRMSRGMAREDILA